MKYLSRILSAILILAPVSIAIDIACTTRNERNDCCISKLVLSSNLSESYNFPVEDSIRLENCTIDFFSPELAGRISDTTKDLSILDGFTPRVYVKRTLTTFTSLDCRTNEVVIDPVDNFNLELLDVSGAIRAVPDNIQHLKKLKVLDLCENEIEEVDLDQFHGLEHLRKLNLGYSRIKSVRLSKDLYLPALAELLLHGNEITTLDLTHLQAVNLQRFYVAQNQLKRIGGFPERYTKLARADLYANKWNCAWLEATLAHLNAAQVETMSFLPDKVCDERGSIKIKKIDCEEN